MIVNGQAHLFCGDEDAVAQVGRTLALNRVGTPDEVADAVLFAVSHLARSVSVARIPVYGGGESPSRIDASTSAPFASER